MLSFLNCFTHFSATILRSSFHRRLLNSEVLTGVDWKCNSNSCLFTLSEKWDAEEFTIIIMGQEDIATTNHRELWQLNLDLKMKENMKMYFKFFLSICCVIRFINLFEVSNLTFNIQHVALHKDTCNPDWPLTLDMLWCFILFSIVFEFVSFQFVWHLIGLLGCELFMSQHGTPGSESTWRSAELRLQSHETLSYAIVDREKIFLNRNVECSDLKILEASDCDLPSCFLKYQDRKTKIH